MLFSGDLGEAEAQEEMEACCGALEDTAASSFTSVVDSKDKNIADEGWLQ